MEPVGKSAGRRAFLRVVADRGDGGAPSRDPEGRVRLRLAGGGRGQGSHVLSALAVAEGLAIVPESMDRVEPGHPVDVWWLDRD
jgi:molybdopterin biosynthesis enzyme